MVFGGRTSPLGPIFDARIRITPKKRSPKLCHCLGGGVYPPPGIMATRPNPSPTGLQGCCSGEASGGSPPCLPLPPPTAGMAAPAGPRPYDVPGLLRAPGLTAVQAPMVRYSRLPFRKLCAARGGASPLPAFEELHLCFASLSLPSASTDLAKTPPPWPILFKRVNL